MKTIAIIEDDIYIGNMLEEILLGNGYHVLRAYSGTEALYLLSGNKPDLVLLDLMLPGLTGEEVLPHIEAVPVIVLSAKVDVQDKIKLLLDGAADYITKPFDVGELLARIAVQLRKADTPGIADVMEAGDLRVNTLSHEVTVNQTPVHLTRTEYAILKLLVQNQDKVVARPVILERISEETPDCSESSLKQHVSNLRKKLRNVSGKDYVEAVWGIGFKLSGKS